VSRHSHIHVNCKAKEYVVKPDTEVANWSSANRSYLSPIKPNDWFGGVRPKPPVDPDPIDPIEPLPPLSNYDVLSVWFNNSSEWCCYGDSVWDTLTNYDELASL